MTTAPTPMADDQSHQPHDRFFLEHLDQIDIVNEDGKRERGDRYVARKRRDAVGGMPERRDKP